GSADVVDASPVTAPERSSPLLDVTLTLPGWGAGVDGTMAIKGFTTGIHADIDDILKNLDMIAAAGLELRHDRFGLILDGMYIKASVGGDTPGSLLSNVSVGIEQVLAEAALSYRILEGERGWLDVLAGARYVYLGSTLDLTIDSPGVRRASEGLSSAVVDRAVDAARDEVDRRLPSLIADLRASASEALEDRVVGRVDEIKDAIRDRIDEGIGGGGGGIGGGIAGSGPVGDAIKEYAKAAAQARLEAARAEASAALGGARSKIRKQAEKRLAKAEKNLARTLEREISERIPDSEIAASKSWVDPFVGLRSQYAIADRWHVSARGDVGGFGVNSDLTMNFFGGLGYQMNERTTVELGYRYLSIDYQSGGFSYDVVTKGPYLGIGIEF
ncbi:MAG: hypothetical protein ACI9NC_001433, partial [Verrucomicrobiales bacterium]